MGLHYASERALRTLLVNGATSHKSAKGTLGSVEYDVAD